LAPHTPQTPNPTLFRRRVALTRLLVYLTAVPEYRPARSESLSSLSRLARRWLQIHPRTPHETHERRSFVLSWLVLLIALVSLRRYKIKAVGAMIPAYARWGFTAFFVTHFLISLLLDAQALAIGNSFPELLKSIMQVSAPIFCRCVACGKPPKYKHSFSSPFSAKKERERDMERDKSAARRLEGCQVIAKKKRKVLDVPKEVCCRGFALGHGGPGP